MTKIQDFFNAISGGNIPKKIKLGDVYPPSHPVATPMLVPNISSLATASPDRLTGGPPGGRQQKLQYPVSPDHIQI